MVEESVHITFDEHNSPSRNIISDDVEEVEQSLEKLDIQPSSDENSQKKDEVQEVSSSQLNMNEGLPREWKIVHNYPTDQLLDDPLQGVKARASLRNMCNHLVFLSQIEPKYFKDVENDEFWKNTMQEEFNQF